jgi:large subunit ribosomal protein L21
MYAVIEAGSRQFKVIEGETLVIDRVAGNEGDKFTFKNVLMIGGDKLVFGAPTVAGAFVEATIKSHTRGKKITIFKYKRRKNYKRTMGHRQPLSVLEINTIKA